MVQYVQIDQRGQAKNENSRFTAEENRMHLPNGFEIVILLVIVLILFGAGRVGKLGGELGTAIREFRKGLAGDEPTSTPTTPPTAPTSDPTKLPPTSS